MELRASFVAEPVSQYKKSRTGIFACPYNATTKLEEDWTVRNACPFFLGKLFYWRNQRTMSVLLREFAPAFHRLFVGAASHGTNFESGVELPGCFGRHLQKRVDSSHRFVGPRDQREIGFQ